MHYELRKVMLYLNAALLNMPDVFIAAAAARFDAPAGGPGGNA